MNWTLALRLVPWAIAALAIGFGLLELANYRGEVVARAEDRRLAEKARADALEDARQRSDRIITEQAEALAQTASKVQGITERIIHVPVTMACAQSPAMRAATDGVRELFGAGGGQTPAGSGAAPAVRGSSAGR